MKKILVSFCFGIISVATLWAATVTEPANLPKYYAAVEGQKSDNLFNAIHTIANQGFSQLSYDNLWTAYEKTDLYPAGHENAGKIWDMYSNCTFTYSTNQCGNYSGECVCYNREHSIPKSWFCSCTTGMGADLFHLVPTDGKVNGKRSNFAFGEVASATYTYDNSQLGSAKNITVTNTVLGSSFTTSSIPSTVFEPADEYKGDFARGYFGTMIKWTTSYTMSSGDGKWFFNNTYTEGGHFGLADYGIALLMKWHRQDPVSQKEIDRNNGIQATQGNRNPFIDYPYLAEYLWGEKAGETVLLEELLGSFDAEFIPGVSNGHRVASTNPIITSPRGSVAFGAVAVNATATQTITVQGRNLTNNVTLTLSGTNANLFSLSATTVSAADAVEGKTITITYKPTAEGNHTATLTLSSTDAASVEVTLTGNGASTYTITYNAGNGTCSTTQSTELSVGAGVELPTAAPAASCTDWTFAGWSTTAVTETQTAPELLQAGDMYHPTANGVLYAVYKMTEGGTGGSTNVVFKVSDIATKNSWVSGTKYSSYTIDGITISYSGGDNEGKYYSSDNSWRSYANGSVVVSGTTTISNVISEPSQTFSKESDGTWKYTGTGKVQFTQFTITVSGTGGPTTYATSPSCQTCTLDGIELNTANVTTAFFVNDEFTSEGLSVTASYSDCDARVVVPTSVSTPDMSSAGTKTVTVSYTENGITKTAGYDITVNAKPTYTITYNAGNGTCSTTQSTELSVGAGVELPTATPAASCTDWTFAGWSTTAVTETQTAPELLQAGDMYHPTANGVLYAVYKMTEGGTGGSTNVVFKVSDIATKNSWVNGTKYSSYTIDGITISYSGGDNDGKYYSSNNSWRSYVNGSVVVSGTTTISNVISEPSQTFSKESDGTWKYIGTDKVQFTQFTITVSGTGGPTTYATSPSCQTTCTLDGIELNTANVTTAFFVDDKFTSEGLVVTASYSDCDAHIVVPTSVSTPDMSSAGTQTVTVSYTENGITKTAGYNIAVNAKPTYTITLNQNAGGTIKADVSSATAGTVVTLSATANAHYTFSEWAVLDGEANDITVTDNQFVMPESNVEVEATFVEIQYAVNTTLTHVTAANDNPTTAGVSDGDILMVFDAETGYQLPATIEVKMGNELLTAGYDYEWTENGVLNIAHTGGITAPLYITIKATPIQYEILFLDDDNTTELAVVQVNHGEIPSYPNATPTKTSTAQYDYTFSGWSPALVAAVDDAIYVAVYTETVRKYTVTFVDADGTELQKSDVEYGAMPTCSSPTKTSTDQYDYTFTGWSPEVVSVTGAATYTAVYTQTVRKYTVTFVDFDGTLLNEQSVEYGQAAVAPQDPTREGYTFAGWDAAFNSITANLTVTATYTKNTETPVCEVVVIDPVCYVTNDLLYVAGLPTGTSLAVFDCTGRLVEQRTAATDTETFDLSNGLYLVRIQANGEQHTLKIVL
ncbi:MAG: endonuclease [Bacteroidales bacterium]|nr:endonuclease [Bacteroidales bacterium]